MKESLQTLSSNAQWHSLVHEAQAKAHLHLSEILEHYLVVLLSRFTRRAQSLCRAVAPHYLEAMCNDGHQRPKDLRNVGDTCLLLSGLFPGRSRKLAVNTGYYIGLGQTAYGEAATHLDTNDYPLFLMLAQRFISVMDVLIAIRLMGDNNSLLPDPLCAYELKQQHGSHVAMQVVSKHCTPTNTIIVGYDSKTNLH
ncbi:MAG: hypothetical protein JKY90_01125 [Gammaproteobacteria bacterium]|nr:hypothetical protein [Gammaproteobacteria bacterium]